MSERRKRVLVIAPHLDDEVLGCGGTIARHVAAGDDVVVLFVAHRVYDHVYNADVMNEQIEHAKKAQAVLDYREFVLLDLPDERLDNCLQDIIIPMEKAFAEIDPEIVYSPYRYDNNQDHRAVAEAVQVVMRPLSENGVKRWLMYETPSSTEQAPNAGTPVFAPTVYIDVDGLIDKKADAMECYEDERSEYPHPRSPEGLRALAMKRGMEAGMKMVEAFMLVRERA